MIPLNMSSLIPEDPALRAAAALLVSLSIAYVIIRHYYSIKHSYWKKRGISGPEPSFLRGTSLAAGDEDFLKAELNRVQKYGKVFGSYDGVVPVLICCDPEVLKDVLIQGFESFPDMLTSNHPIQSLSLGEANGKRWRDMRTLVNPTFTSGKLKGMHSIMKHMIGDLLQHMDRKIADGSQDFECMSLFGNYSLDVLIKVAFSMDCNSNEAASDNAIVKNVKRFFTIDKTKLFLEQTLPSFVQKMIGFTFANTEAVEILVREARVIREQRRADLCASKTFNDLLQSMIDAERMGKDGKVDKLTENEIIANIFVFLLAGSQSTSVVVACAAYLLAKHPEVQQKLRQEVSDAIQADGGEIKYDTILSLPYLNAVINETLRVYPPVSIIERICVKDYRIESLNMTMTKGSKVNVPIYAIHHQEEFFPNHDQFDPERFMPENASKLVPNTFIPFMTGPRNCMGSRFALLKGKTTLAALILKYNFDSCPRTAMDLSGSTIFLVPKEIMIRFSMREGDNVMTDKDVLQVV